jgi:nicotinate-nucleotide adenylyltransferase
MAKRIAIFGGTFDPIHNGHVRVFEQVMEALPFDEGWLMVAGSPRLRDTEVSPAAVRVRMAEAVASEHGWKVCDIETRRPGPTYTSETARELHAAHSGMTFDFVVGADAASRIREWHDWQELLRERFVILNRTGVEPMAASAAANLGFDPETTTLLRVESPAISATSIRGDVAAGRKLDDAVPAGVARIIATEGLYRRAEVPAWHNDAE